MKTSNIVAVGVGLLLIKWVKSRKDLFTNASFFISGVRVDGSILAPELYIKIGVINPTLNSQDINAIEGNIFLNDTTLIGNVLQLNKQTIAPNTTSFLDLPVNVKLSGLLTTISQLIKTKSGKYSFVGSVNVYGLNVPINQSYTI